MQRIVKTAEFRRIEALPRREWQSYDMQHLLGVCHREFKLPSGKMSLWPQQAAALYDAWQNQGAFCQIGVGGGKSLTSFLMPHVLGAKRPMLLVPASLRDKAINEDLPILSEHWALHSGLMIYGYEALSLEKNSDMLQQLKPDALILDECHRVKDKKSARTRRIIRYLKDAPATKVVALSGTVSKKSIMDYHHIIVWCLKHNAPLPIPHAEAALWAALLDEGVRDDMRPSLGAFVDFCARGESPRAGYQRRLSQTPGVIVTQNQNVDASLNIRTFSISVSKEAEEHISTLRDWWELPNGDICKTGVERWAHMRQLALGFFYKWDPAPPMEWLDARREYNSTVRKFLTYSRTYDTELQARLFWARQHMEGKLDPSHPIYAWERIKDTFVPNSVPVWIDDFAVDWCAKWLKKRGEPRILWTEHVCFAERVSQKSGCPYFGAGDDAGVRQTKEHSIILSIAAHSEGKNLQDRYAYNLISSIPPSGKTMEQLLGRTHRAGQKRDEVTCDVMLNTIELEESFVQAKNEARYLEDSLGQQQKLNFATFVKL